MRASARLVVDRGAGTVTALGLISAMLGLTLTMFAFGDHLLKQQRLNLVTDNAAVAAADSLRGLIAGFPCDVARQMAPVSKCTIDGNDVLIETRSDGLTARSRAGE